ncbi:MAG: amidohydrolase family protein [Chitinophagaceae bacterium]|nr:amidohydrolase family protein [Chitinophagaceae bacterium]
MVQDGKITSITKGKKLNPVAGTMEIDGTNQWLMPGLADAHVHFFQSGGLYTRPDAIDLRKYRPYADEIKWSHEHFEELLRMYLSAGITSVTDVGATINLLQQRDSFANKPYAPLIQMTGPLITTWLPRSLKTGKDAPFVEIKNEQEARKAVQDQLPYHPDFIKIWYIVTDPNVEAGARKNIAMVKAVIDEAHANGKRVAVHAMEKITAQLAVKRVQII